MRPFPSQAILIALLTAALTVPAGAQTVVEPMEPVATAGPNARAAQRRAGPNARAAQRPLGPNLALMKNSKTAREPAYYPSCAAAGVARATPVRRGEPGYGRHLDGDDDGIACE